MKAKNNTVEFWRYFFTVLVCLLHFESNYYPEGVKHIYQCGYLAVEFFFILSGFLIMKRAEKLLNQNNELIPSKEAYYYTIQKYLRFLPYLIFSWVLLIITRTVLFDYNYKDIIKDIYIHFWEYVCLNSTTVTWEILNGPTWYLSSLLIVGFFIYFLVLKNKDLFIGFIAPFSVLLIYGYYASIGQGLDFHLQYAKFLNGATNRAIAGLSLGCISYCIYKELREIKFNKIQILFANLLEILSICSFFVLIINNDKDNSNLIVLFPFVFIIILSFLNITIISKLLNNTFSNLLGKASLVMYLNQVFFIGAYIRHFRTASFKTDSILFVIELTVLSFLVQYFYDLIGKNIKKHKFGQWIILEKRN